MNCEDIRRRYLDHDLRLPSLEAAVSVASHFAECAECRHAARQFDDLRQALREPEASPGSSGAAPPFVFPLSEPNTAASSRPRGDRWAGSGLAWAVPMAAMLLISLAGWAMYLAGPAGRLAGGPGAPSEAMPSADRSPAGRDAVRWTQAEIDRGMTVFAKVSETFDGRAGWVAVGDRATDMGLLEGPAQPQPKVLLVRLIMSRGAQPPSTTDLMIVPGQDASVELPFESGQVLRYRVRTASGQQSPLALAAEVQSQDGRDTLAGLTTQLRPKAGEVVAAGQLTSQSGRYHLDVAFSETSLGRP